MYYNVPSPIVSRFCLKRGLATGGRSILAALSGKPAKNQTCVTGSHSFLLNRHGVGVQPGREFHLVYYPHAVDGESLSGVVGYPGGVVRVVPDLPDLFYRFLKGSQGSALHCRVMGMVCARWFPISDDTHSTVLLCCVFFRMAAFRVAVGDVAANAKH